MQNSLTIKCPHQVAHQIKTNSSDNVVGSLNNIHSSLVVPSIATINKITIRFTLEFQKFNNWMATILGHKILQ